MPTHIRSIIGQLRYDTDKELEVINDLYRNELRLYKNFFSPVMKLKEKVRQRAKIHRRYDIPKTPYQRLVESSHVPTITKARLTALYRSLNPGELKRGIDDKIHRLYRAYEEKNSSSRTDPLTKQELHTVRFYVTQQE